MANNQITPFQLTDQFTMDNFNQRINETNTALQNKAPAGYGLGELSGKILTASDNIDNIRVSGIYTYSWNPSEQPSELPAEAKYHDGLMIVTAGVQSTVEQKIVFVKDSSTVNTGDNCTVHRLSLGTSAWQPWEWVNPPMDIGKEYRTTERYNGKPVYKRAVNIGDITGNGKSTFASNGATTVLSGELLYRGYLPFTYINGHDLNNSWTRYANVDSDGSNIEVSYFIGSSCGTSNNTVVILRYLKD